ncbi:OmpA family protein [Actinoplanes sp. N902-109]|uniref:OmpA family protein n=1 Tax=Actinoplanes sp. (strain N902-109) TaxID=649831 RepID=UPI0003294D18|nr:OmpA family protein [Actinoplanes sp. N902-109]AGL18262.1 OmpA/MotB domain-containing protein [Actinoplanes sp. N902-109]
MRRLLVLALVVTLASGCTDDKAAPPPPVPAAPAAGSAAPAAPPRVETRRVDAAGDQLTMSIGPLVRAGDTVYLTADTRLDSGGSTRLSRPFSATGTTTFDGARLVDPVGRRVYLPAEGSRGCVCSSRVRADQGETQPLRAGFTGVPADVHSLAVMLPYAGVFAEVPIVAGPAPDDLATGDATSFVGDLAAYTERLDVGLRTRQRRDGVDLDLDTDVLFRLDSAQLTPQAGKTVAAAVDAIEAAGPGPLTVTGHTDDTGTTEHNQTLSQQRAEAVAKALKLPAARWPVTVAAKGETQPAVPNTDAAARARNRRVTIAFRGTPQLEPKDVPLPRTDGVQGKAGDGVDVQLPLHRGTVHFTTGTATRHDAFLQVDLVATAVGGKATILDFLGQGVFTARNEFDPYAKYGAAGVRLLAGDTAALPLDYEREPGDHRCLCDRLLNQAIPENSSQTISLWFPAPPAGATTVTLDVPDKLRLTGIPIA